jgi:tetratricopeptide (TPR) repeat protein
MLIRYKLFDITALWFMLVFSSAGFAHDGHEDQDMVLPNLGNLGIVNFPVSCSDGAQKAMNTGVGLIHHMMYAQAEKLFGNWIEREPDCAMLYWGYSMTLFHPLWPDTITEEALDRGSIAIKKAQALDTSERELSYINATAAYYDNWQTNADDSRIRAWAEAQQGVYQKYPSDIDAGAFRALAQIVTAPKTDPTFSQNREAGALLEKLNKISPTHPGSIHYTIHAYDSAPLAELAIDYARAYDKIAPDVPHALHMPSHIFVRLGMWDDAISWNIRSAKAALNYPTKGSTSMHYVHAMDYLIYGYLQLEKGEEAKQAMKSMAGHQPVQATFPAAYAFAAIPARLALEQQQWQRASAIKTQNPDYIAWEKFPQVEAITYYARGLGAARLGDLKKAGENVSALDALFEKTRAISPDYWAPLVDAQRQVINAWISYEAGNTASALVQLRKAADIEDSMDKNPVTPGAVLPARELLADMLMLHGDYSDALLAYEKCLSVGPNRSNSLEGVARAKLAMAQ